MTKKIFPEGPINWGDFSDWEVFSQVERDICYLYHELAQGLDDLSWRQIYQMPYWEFLEIPLPEMAPEESYFIRSGCLVMIHAMAWDMLIGASFQVRDKIPHCQQIIARLVPDDENMARLIEIVKITLNAALQDKKTIENHEAWLAELFALGQWVNETFVTAYFEAMVVQALRRNPPADNGGA